MIERRPVAMAPQQPRSFARQLSGDFARWDLGRGTGPLAGDRPPGVPGGCTTKGCQQHLPPGNCPLVLTSPAVVVTRHQQHLCLESQAFPFPMEAEGSLRRSTGMWAHLCPVSPSLHSLPFSSPCWSHPGASWLLSQWSLHPCHVVAASRAGIMA